MTMYLAKTLLFLAVCLVAVALGVVTWFASGRSPAVFVTTIVGALTIQTALLVPVMALAFRRLDPSSSAPL